jgi:hypothetical protein
VWHRTDRGTLQTWLRLLSNQWSTISSGKPWCALCIPWNYSLIYKHHIPFLLSHDTRSCPRLDHWYPYIVFTLVRHSFNSFMTLHPPWPSHTLASFIDANVTEWAQSIYPSRGWTNPALGAHASNLPHWHTQETFFSQSFYGRDSWCNQSILRM